MPIVGAVSWANCCESIISRMITFGS